MTPRDPARIGLMLLNGGLWNGGHIPPAQWVERSTSPIVDVDEIHQYRYHWYLGKFALRLRRGRAGIARASIASGAQLAMVARDCSFFSASI
jgi:hypothetical protein